MNVPPSKPSLHTGVSMVQPRVTPFAFTMEKDVWPGLRETVENEIVEACRTTQVRAAIEKLLSIYSICSKQLEWSEDTT